MAKASMLQTILHRPSRRYSMPASKDYHSTAEHMRRVAIAANQRPDGSTEVVTRVVDWPPSTPPRHGTHGSNLPAAIPHELQDISDDSNESDDEVFYTPRSSPTAASSARSSLADPAAVAFPNTSPSISSSKSTDTATSVFSAAISASTTATTPHNSDQGHAKLTDGSPARTLRHTHRRRKSEDFNATRNSWDDDWAKDLFWLPTPRAPSKLSSAPSTEFPASHTIPQIEIPPPQTTGPTHSKSTRSTDGRPKPRVSTVYEDEDEDEYRRQSVRRRSRTLSTSIPSSSLQAPLPASSAYPAHPGYTTLTLPRAAYTPGSPGALASGKVDLTRSGTAQTTMATVEVVGGIAQHRRKLSLSRPARTPGAENALGFTSHVPPPSFVPPGYILAQVHAVGLDSVDERLARGKGPGFIPGRSFVGRAVECGSEVRDDVMRKGDWLVGLLDIRKSGALSEFVLVDRRRSLRAPQPANTDRRRSQVQLRQSGLPLEHLAVLPLCGVPAHRVLQTLPKRPGARALVLGAQTGAARVAMQLMRARGVHIVAQGGRRGAADEVVEGAPLDVLDAGRAVDFVLDAVGGRAVWDASVALLAAPAGCRCALGEEWCACAREWDQGQFTTLVGDAPERPVPGAQEHFTAGMRSLGMGRAVARKRSVSRQRGQSVDETRGKQAATPGRRSADTAPSKPRGRERKVAYAWVNPAADVDVEGGDVRDALAAMLRLAEEGALDFGLCEKGTGAVVPFERAPELFKGRGVLRRGETAVVKVMG